MGLKTLAKRVVKRTLVKSGGLAMAVRIAPAGAVVLMYHSITEDPESAANSIGVSQPRSSFDAHVRTIAQRFAPVTMERVAQFAKEGRRLPPRSVAVTFDDGYADNYDVALPVLSRYGVPATFYIMVNAVETGIPPWYCRLNFAFRTTRRPEWTDPDQRQSYKIERTHEKEAALKTAFALGARKTGSQQEEFVRRIEKSLEVEPLGCEAGLMLNWEKVRALNTAGHSIGGHTLSHPNLAHVTEEEARTEILGCKKRLEAEIGEPVDHFSYPHPALNPQWSPQTLQITREVGFKSAVLTTCGPVRQGDEPLALKRIYAADELDQWLWNLDCTFLGRSI